MEVKSKRAYPDTSRFPVVGNAEADLGESPGFPATVVNILNIAVSSEA